MFRSCPVAAALGVLLFATPARAADAKAVYEKLCSSCHGSDGRGNPEKAKSLKIDPKLLNLGRPDVAGIDRAKLRTILLEGKDAMPAYGNGKKLKPPDVDPVLDHAISLAEAARRK
jgi:cytochrome c5